jgi:hypothetical protein
MSMDILTFDTMNNSDKKTVVEDLSFKEEEVKSPSSPSCLRPVVSMCCL